MKMPLFGAMLQLYFITTERVACTLEGVALTERESIRISIVMLSMYRISFDFQNKMAM